MNYQGLPKPVAMAALTELLPVEFRRRGWCVSAVSWYDRAARMTFRRDAAEPVESWGFPSIYCFIVPGEYSGDYQFELAKRCIEKGIPVIQETEQRMG